MYMVMMGVHHVARWNATTNYIVATLLDTVYVDTNQSVVVDLYFNMTNHRFSFQYGDEDDYSITGIDDVMRRVYPDQEVNIGMQATSMATREMMRDRARNDRTYVTTLHFIHQFEPHWSMERRRLCDVYLDGKEFKFVFFKRNEFEAYDWRVVSTRKLMSLYSINEITEMGGM